ncbi:MAG: extracellular solute-binding protein [Micromonosporaceae bacterium]|nr:extracellular solute-binding protein [Micromonosporaceae bacterium]
MIRWVGRLVAAALLAASLAGCGDGGGRDGAVRLLVFGAPEELAAYRKLVAAYRETAPGQKVRLIEASDRADLIARLATSISGGAPPDIVLINYRFYGQFAAKNALQPVDARLRDSERLAADDFYPQAMEAFQWGGKQLCMPQNVSSLAVYYNRDLFKRYQVPEPKAGWTWNDLISTASALTRDANGAVMKGTESEGGAAPAEVHGLGVEPTMIRIAPFVWSNGGELVDDPKRPTRFTLDTPAARQALRDFLDLRLAYGVTPTDEEVESEDDESRFANGRLAMVMSSRRATTTFRHIKDFEWDVAPLPTYGDAPVGILHSDAYCMTRGARNQDGAWRFVEFAVGAKGAKIMAGTGRTVPSNMDIATSEAFLDPNQPPRNAQVFLDTIPTIRRAPMISTWPEIEDVTDDILENAFYRGDRLDDVLREIDRQTRPLFARGEGP